MISSYAKKAKKLNQVFAAVAIIAVVGSGGSRLYSHVQPSLTQMLAKSNAQQEETKKAKYNDNNPKLLAQAMEAKKTGTFYVYSQVTTDDPVSMDGVEGEYIWLIRFTLSDPSAVDEEDVNSLIENAATYTVRSASSLNFCGQKIPFSKKLAFFSSHNSTEFIKYLKTVAIDKNSFYVYCGIPADGSLKGSANIDLKDGKIESANEFEVGQTMDDVKSNHHNELDGFYNFASQVENRPGE